MLGDGGEEVGIWARGSASKGVLCFQGGSRMASAGTLAKSPQFAEVEAIPEGVVDWPRPRE